LQHARRRGLWARRVVLKSVGFRRASGAPPRLSVPLRAAAIFLDWARAASGRRASRGTRAPVETHASGSSHSFVGLASLEDQLLDFFVRW